MMPLVNGKCILRSRTSTNVLLATSVSTIYLFLRCLQCGTRGLSDGDLHLLEPGLTPPFRVGLLLGVGHVHPAGFQVSRVACYRVKRGHGTADGAGESAARHERAAGWRF